MKKQILYLITIFLMTCGLNSCFSSKSPEENSKSEVSSSQNADAASTTSTSSAKESSAPENPNKELSISAGLTQQQVNTVVQGNSQEIRQCYEKFLKKKKTASGQVTLKLIIDANGRVASAKISDAKVGDKKMKQCIVKNIKRWTFPKPREVDSVNITYPIVLSPN